MKATQTCGLDAQIYQKATKRFGFSMIGEWLSRAFNGIACQNSAFISRLDNCRFNEGKRWYSMTAVATVVMVNGDKTNEVKRRMILRAGKNGNARITARFA